MSIMAKREAVGPLVPPASTGDTSRRPPGLRDEATVLADLFTVGLLKLGIRALGPLQAAFPRPPARDTEPAPQLPDASTDGQVDGRVDGRSTHTVRFGLDGGQYEIDLDDEGAADFRGAVQRYIDVARVLGPSSRPRARRPGDRRRPSTAPPPPTDLSAVRQWARANGYQVSDRGRVAARVLAAYTARE
jgi:Lsr2